MMDGAILINDKQYYLKFNINTLCEMKVAGIDVMKMEEEMDFIQIRALFYFGLKKIHGQELKTVEDAGDLLSDYIEGGGDLETLGNIISNALVKSLGIKAAVEGK